MTRMGLGGYKVGLEGVRVKSVVGIPETDLDAKEKGVDKEQQKPECHTLARFVQKSLICCNPLDILKISNAKLRSNSLRK
jgi:hypothetical protein